MYTFKEVKLKNAGKQKSILAIEFDDPTYAIVAEFLMSDASMFDYHILNEIDVVLAGKRINLKSNGNRCALTIGIGTTKIEDLLDGMFDDIVTHQPLEISTKELKHLINVWKQKSAKLHKK